MMFSLINPGMSWKLQESITNIVLIRKKSVNHMTQITILHFPDIYHLKNSGKPDTGLNLRRTKDKNKDSKAVFIHF